MFKQYIWVNGGSLANSSIEIYASNKQEIDKKLFRVAGLSHGGIIYAK